MKSTKQIKVVRVKRSLIHDDTKLPGTAPVIDLFEDPDSGSGGGSKLPGTVPIRG
jgi:hypothetical protein